MHSNKPTLKKKKTSHKLEKVKSFVDRKNLHDKDYKELDKFKEWKNMKYDYTNCFQDLLPFNKESKKILRNLKAESKKKSPYLLHNEPTPLPEFNAIKAYSKIHKLYKDFKYIRHIELQEGTALTKTELNGESLRNHLVRRTDLKEIPPKIQWKVALIWVLIKREINKSVKSEKRISIKLNLEHGPVVIQPKRHYMSLQSDELEDRNIVGKRKSLAMTLQQNWINAGIVVLIITYALLTFLFMAVDKGLDDDLVRIIYHSVESVFIVLFILEIIFYKYAFKELYLHNKFNIINLVLTGIIV